MTNNPKNIDPECTFHLDATTLIVNCHKGHNWKGHSDFSTKNLPLLKNQNQILRKKLQKYTVVYYRGTHVLQISYTVVPWQQLLHTLCLLDNQLIN